MAARPPSRLNPTTSNSTHPRRTLFSGTNAPRRPTGTATTASNNANISGTTLTESTKDSAEDAEILARNADGSYAAMIPELQRTEAEVAATEEEDEGVARLGEFLKDRRGSTETELLETLTSNLRRNVASLEEDKWMFEHDKGES